MKNKLSVVIAFLAYTLSFGQSFEGKLTYNVEFDIKTQKIGNFEITKDEVIEKLKKEGEYFDTVTVTLKGGNYIKEDNSESEKRIIYRSDLNKIYTFNNGYGEEVETDAKRYNTLNIFKEPKIEKLDSIKNINGIECNLLKLSWNNFGEEYYFYNSNVGRLDPKLFKNHNYEYFNIVVENTNAYPLEIVKKISNFISVKMTLQSISEEKVNDELFDINKIKARKLSYQENNTKWKTFRDDKIGYVLEYPEKWIPDGGKGGFMCGLKSGYANAEFSIIWSEVDNSERIDMFFNEEGLYEGYNSIEKEININGINGVYYLRTHEEKPDEYYESIILKTKSTWYSISNSGTKNNLFEHFYKSFKLTK